ncbi:MAG: peptidylprolyl isomerase [Candidatus Acidiferrales bacterium]|jgi:peptidyl-prolyl cis-trans isomerase SurA
MRLNRIAIVFLAAASIALVAPRVRAQVAPTATKDAKDVDMKGSGNGRVVEEIVARVNNEIISYSEYQKSETELHEEVKQDCQGCAQDRLNAMYEERQKNLLRDQIDQSLLEQRAKDLGISVENDVIKRLDQVRQQNNFPSMEALQAAVEGQGMSWEDYKANFRNQLLTQEVIRREVGSRVDIGRDDVKKYYEDHKQDFVRPEQVVLADIFLSTEGKTPEQVAVIQKKANDLLARLKKGDDFSELAKRNSEGPTAKDGGELGAFERGQLSKQLEDTVFALNKNQLTDVVQTKTGFEILKVIEHFEAGLQPVEKVGPEIENRIYAQRMQPILRNYLGELREESYVVVKPGYVDTAAVSTNVGIKEVAPTPDAAEKKLSRKAKKAAASQ